MVPGFQISFDILLLYINGKGEERRGMKGTRRREGKNLCLLFPSFSFFFLLVPFRMGESNKKE